MVGTKRSQEPSVFFFLLHVSSPYSWLWFTVKSGVPANTLMPKSTIIRYSLCTIWVLDSIPPISQWIVLYTTWHYSQLYCLQGSFLLPLSIKESNQYGNCPQTLTVTFLHSHYCWTSKLLDLCVIFAMTGIGLPLCVVGPLRIRTLGPRCTRHLGSTSTRPLVLNALAILSSHITRLDSSGQDVSGHWAMVFTTPGSGYMYLIAPP